MLAVCVIASGCSHTRYSECHVPSTLLFHVGDKVKSNAPCTPTMSFLTLCHAIGVVVEVTDFKSVCYPQPLYTVQYVAPSKIKVQEAYCSAQLLLQPGQSQRSTRNTKDTK